MPGNTPPDEVGVLARPLDRAPQPFADIDLGGETELPCRLLGRREALAGAVPVTGGAQVERGGVAGVFVDQGGEIEDGRLGAGGQVVDPARRTLERARHQAAGHVLDEDEVAAGIAAVVERQGLAVQRTPDEGRCDIAPDRVHRPPPLAGPKDLARPVDVGEARLDDRQAAALEVVVAVQLADDLGDRVGAVMVERDRLLLGGRRRRVVGLLGDGTGGRGIDHLLQVGDPAQPVEQLERGQRVVLVVGERVGDRGLVAVKARQVKGVVQVLGQPGENTLVGDRAEDETDPRVGRDVGDVRRQQVVDDDDLARRLFEDLVDEVAADEAGAADHQDPGVGKVCLSHACLSLLPGRGHLEVRVDVGDPVGVVPSELAPHGVGETDLRPPAQQTLGLGRVQRDHGDVVRGRRHDRHLDGPQAQVIGDQVEDLLDRVRLAAGDVERADRCPGCDRQVHEGQEIAHVEEIAQRIGTEAALARLEPLVEGRDRADRQARPGDVGDA